MRITTNVPPEDTKLFTEDELLNDVMYQSTMSGSKGFLFIRLGQYLDRTVLAISNNAIMKASKSHGRDFYIAPRGTKITIESD